MNRRENIGYAVVKDTPDAVYMDRLMHSEYGITPVYGVEVRENRPHVHPQRFVCGKEVQLRGKKHIEPHHVSLGDDVKREEGRYGKRHVPFGNGYGDTAGMELQATAPVRHGVVPRSQTISTSMQLSEARLRQIAKNPRYQREARELLQQSGDYSIVHREKCLSRRVAAEQYSQGSDARCAELRDNKQRDDLGPPGAAINTQVPFALDASVPRADNMTVHRKAHYHNAESLQQAQRVPGRTLTQRYQYAHAQVRDNVELSRNEYPDPPAVGVRVPRRAKFRSTTAQRRTATCLDEEVLRRAKARCHRSGSSRMPDFIFGQPPPVEAPRSTLRSSMEDRWRAAEERTAQRRTGLAMTYQSHKPTALW